MPKHLTLTQLIILVNIAVFGLQRWVGHEMLPHFALWPLQESPYNEGSLFRPWQLLTHGFMHGDGTLEVGLLHLFFNMFGLFMLGERIDELLGTRRYLIYYLVCIVGSGAFHSLVNAMADLPYAPTVGASGGLFGLLLAFAMAFPKERLLLIFIPLPAWLFVTVYGAIELYLGVTQSLAGIAHFAHLGGIVTGFVMMCLWRQRVRESLRRLTQGV